MILDIINDKYYVLHTVILLNDNQQFNHLFFVSAKCKPVVVGEIAVASKNINGIAYQPMIRTTIAKAFSWIGSYFHHVVYAAVIPFRTNFSSFAFIACRLLSSFRNLFENRNIIELFRHNTLGLSFTTSQFFT